VQGAPSFRARSSLRPPARCVAAQGLPRRIVYEDSAKIDELRQLIASRADASSDMLDSLALATSRAKNAIACEGNLQLHPLLAASGLDLLAAVDYEEAWIEPEPEPLDDLRARRAI
jgi:hypothetical protein